MLIRGWPSKQGRHRLLYSLLGPQLDGEGDELGVLLDERAQLLVVRIFGRVLLQVQRHARAARQRLAIGVLLDLHKSPVSLMAEQSLSQGAVLLQVQRHARAARQRLPIRVLLDLWRKDSAFHDYELSKGLRHARAMRQRLNFDVLLDL